MNNRSQRKGRALYLLRNRAILFGLACILAVLTVATFPMVSNILTNAKYAAQSTLDAEARVAKWEVRLDNVTPLPLTPLTIAGLPALGGTAAGHKLILFFEGLEGNKNNPDPVDGDASFKVKFVNDSEVSARFTPNITVATPTDSTALTAVKNSITFKDGSTNITTTGVVLAPGTEKLVDVVITDCTFSGLNIGAFCEQVN